MSPQIPIVTAGYVECGNRGLRASQGKQKTARIRALVFDLREYKPVRTVVRPTQTPQSLVVLS